MKTTLLAILAALPLVAQEGAPQPPQGPAPEKSAVPAATCRPAKHRHHHHRHHAAPQQPIVIVVQCPCAHQNGAPAPKPGCCGPKPEGKPGCGAPAPKPGCCGPKPEGKPGCGAPARKPGCFKGPKLSPEQMKARHEAFMAKFDTNKDGKIDEQEKAAIKAAFEARKAEFHKKLLEKFDTNKDGKLDEQEKAAMKAEFAKRRCGRKPAAPAPEAPAPAPEAPAPAPETPAPAPAPEAEPAPSAAPAA